jgi:hypothetical protein
MEVIMMGKLKLFFSNWKTGVPGIIALVCASDQVVRVLPDEIATYLLAVCGFAVAVGLIAAKDADRSNATNPSAVAVKVP